MNNDAEKREFIQEMALRRKKELLKKTPLHTEITKKRREIKQLIADHLGNSIFGLHFRKPSPLRRLELGIKKCMFGENSELLKQFPKLRMALRKKKRKDLDELLLSKKINAGSMAYLNIFDGEGKDKIITKSLEKRKIQFSNNFITVQDRTLFNINKEIYKTKQIISHLSQKRNPLNTNEVESKILNQINSPSKSRKPTLKLNVSSNKIHSPNQNENRKNSSNSHNNIIHHIHHNSGDNNNQILHAKKLSSQKTTNSCTHKHRNSVLSNNLTSNNELNIKKYLSRNTFNHMNLPSLLSSDNVNNSNFSISHRSEKGLFSVTHNPNATNSSHKNLNLFDGSAPSSEKPIKVKSFISVSSADEDIEDIENTEQINHYEFIEDSKIYNNQSKLFKTSTKIKTTTPNFECHKNSEIFSEHKDSKSDFFTPRSFNTSTLNTSRMKTPPVFGKKFMKKKMKLSSSIKIKVNDLEKDTNKIDNELEKVVSNLDEKINKVKDKVNGMKMQELNLMANDLDINTEELQKNAQKKNENRVSKDIYKNQMNRLMDDITKIPEDVALYYADQIIQIYDQNVANNDEGEGQQFVGNSKRKKLGVKLDIRKKMRNNSLELRHLEALIRMEKNKYNFKTIEDEMLEKKLEEKMRSIGYYI